VTEPVGVLVMAYGTPEGPDDVERYYTHIRGGRTPSPERLEELRGRYEAIGNTFPLARITREQAHGLEEELNRAESGASFRTYIGMKHSPPFIGDAVAAMHRDGVERAVGIVLAPHYSRLSVGTYIDRAVEARPPGLELSFVESWYDHPDFLSLITQRVKAAFEELNPQERDGAVTIFSAHSLPARIEEWGDPYPRQLQETADAVATRLELDDVRIAWQSESPTGEPWLQPTLEAVIEQAAGSGAPAVVVCPCGFVADHLEVLYDIDIEAQQLTRTLGIRLMRTASPNADAPFVRVLADVVRRQLSEGTGSRVRHSSG
jgi:protoporphyrin/coproporphyrin ferrochelatase